MRRGPAPAPALAPRPPPRLTLGAHQRQHHLTGTAVAAEQLEQPRRLLEAALALQAEDADDGVRPAGKLGGTRTGGSGLGTGRCGLCPAPAAAPPPYLGVRGSRLLPDEQEVALAIDRHLALELATCSRGERGHPPA